MKGGNRPGSGRPAGTVSRKPLRGVAKQIRWTEDEWARIEAAAKALKSTPSKMIRETMLAAIEPHLKKI